MSSLSFMTRDGETAVSGREHAKFSCLLTDLTWWHIHRDLNPDEVGRASLLRDAVDLPDYVLAADNRDFARYAKTALAVQPGSMSVHLPGRPAVANAFEVALNTVTANSSDPVALAVRLMGQSEVNAWIDGPDRAWAADLIDAGRRTAYPPHVADTDYLRQHTLFADEPSVNGHYDGWPAVVAALRADDTAPVVLSYSVTDGFPGRAWAAYPDDPDPQQPPWWETGTPEQRWDASLDGLRRRTADCPSLQITPGNLHDPRFGTTVAPTWLQVAAAWNNPERNRP